MSLHEGTLNLLNKKSSRIITNCYLNFKKLVVLFDRMTF